MSDVDSILNQVRTNLQEGRLSEAADACDGVLAAYPDNVDAMNLLGVIRLKENQPLDALMLFENGLQLTPTAPHLLNNAGEALMMMRRFTEAMQVFGRALELEPNYGRARRNLGAAHAETGQLQNALLHFAAVAETNPDDVRNWSNLGEAARRMARLEEAAGCFRKALAIDSRFSPAHRGLGLTLRDQGMIEEAIEQFRTGIHVDPDDPGIQQDLLLTLNLSDSAETADILAAHRKWGQRIARLSGQPLKISADRNPQRPLRIGYVAPEFRDPEWAPMLQPLVAAHNRSEFEISCYATSIDAAEDDQKPVRGARRLRGLDGLTDRAAAELIATDRIDILVDLCGHMPSSRPGVFALKPAPLIMSWARYPVVTGLPAIDYRLTDRVIDPEATANPGGDTTIRLPGGAFCWTPLAEEPEPGRPPSEEIQHITFGCMTSLYHVSTQTTANWAAILRRLPEARLHVAAKGSEDAPSRHRLVSAFGLLGIDEDRVSVTPYPEDAGNSEFWTAIDIALDTQPWNSVQDSCSALWMGVPVLTMRGETAAGRLGASLLIHAGLSDLVAETRGRQVEAAVALARDSERLAELRRTLRDKIKTSPLGDGARLARELEAAYRRLWRRWCRSGPEAIGPTPDGEETSDAAGSRAAAVAGVEPTEAKKLLLGSRLARQGWAPVTTETGHGVETSRMGRPQPLRERHHRGDLCAQPVGAA